jgi:outer membrane lipoprotein LolB
MNNLHRLLIISFCLLTACAPPRPTEFSENKIVSKEQIKEKEEAVTSWQIRGAMAAKNKAKGWSAAMSWIQHGPNSYQIRLMGPLGSGTVLIDQKGNTITFQDGSKKIASHNADELLAQQTGIKLPVNNLYYWIRGLPAPGPVAAEHRDQNNHLVQLKQSGYTINFAKYTTVKGIDLPALIHLEGNGVMVKVVIQNWAI